MSLLHLPKNVYLRIVLNYIAMVRKSLIFAVLMLSVVICRSQSIKSPDGRLSLTFKLTPEGEPTYALNIGYKPVILPSKMGIEAKDIPAFTAGCTVKSVDTTLVDETWKPVWGEVNQIRNNYRQMVITLQQPDVANRWFRIVFRLFNDGVGFRYEFPEQPGLQYLTLTDEHTQFQLTGNHYAFWIPGDYESNEYAYSHTRLSDANAEIGKNVTEIGTRTVIGADYVQSPLMMKTDDGLYINIFEAALVNYPAMHLHINKKTFCLESQLVPDAIGNKAYLQTSFNTPWRTVLVSDKATDILASKTILNLNEPCKIADPSWIKPMKFVGIWWDMHVGTKTWNYADVNNVKLGQTDWNKLTPNGHHGATTGYTKKYIDFAAANGIGGVLVEGWNVGWEDWYGKYKEEVFDFVTPYPDYDVAELQRYAASKGVKIIMHHETSASATNYERRMDSAYRFMKHFGFDAVKSGYVGRIIPRGEFHDGQWMVSHYLRAVTKAAGYKIMVDAHEPVRPTGLQRTWPNLMACEAARGNEFNAWSVGNPPEHETILPFTRLMGGPMDYTPGIFSMKMERYLPERKDCMVHTTLTKQLALYLTMYSPIQMAADLIENYEARPDAFQFIKDVAVDWDNSWYLEAEPGDYITVARKAKGEDKWFVGAITDENSRMATAPLSFLPEGRKYVATLYTDAPDAHWKNNPEAYTIGSYLVDAKTVLKLKLAAGGGAAVSIRAVTDADKKLKKYRP